MARGTKSTFSSKQKRQLEGKGRKSTNTKRLSLTTTNKQWGGASKKSTKKNKTK